MSEEIRLCDFNISELTLKQIKKLFQTLMKQNSNLSSLMCQHKIKITRDRKKLIFRQENCTECRNQLKNPNRSIEEKYQLTGVLIYLLGNQQIEQAQKISNYDLAQQIFKDYIGFFKDIFNFQSICSIFDLNTYQSIQNKITEVKSKIINDEDFLLPIHKEIKFEKYVLIVVNNFSGQLKNNDVVDVSFLIESFKKFLEQYQKINQYIESNQLCIHNVNLRSKNDDIWKLSINFYNIECDCQIKGLANLFFVFVTNMVYNPQNLDIDESNLINQVINLIEENHYSDEFDNLQKIFTEYEIQQNKMFPSNYPEKNNQKKISFFSLPIYKILLKLNDTYLWKGYQIYVLQDFIERIENEMILYNKEYSQYLNNYKREQVQQMQNFLQNIKINLFSKIILYYTNLSEENSQQQQVDQLSEELKTKRNYVQTVLQSQSSDESDKGFQSLLEKRLNFQQLRQSNLVHSSNIQQGTGIYLQEQQSSIISQQI